MTLRGRSAPRVRARAARAAPIAHSVVATGREKDPPPGARVRTGGALLAVGGTVMLVGGVLAVAFNGTSVTVRKDASDSHRGRALRIFVAGRARGSLAPPRRHARHRPRHRRQRVRQDDDLPPPRRGLHTGLYRVLYVSMTTGNVMDLYKSIAWELGLPTERSRAAVFRQIRDEVSRLCAENRLRPVLIVDEAHHLYADLLEDLRLLTNYAMDSENPPASG
jgi:hypothetical protein